MEHVLEQLAGLGEIEARKMFGGHGLYCGGHFFALIARSVLYLKVDDSNRSDFEARGCQGFQPDLEKPGRMNYFEIPFDVLERPQQAVEWAQRSVEIARRNPPKKRKSGSKRQRVKSSAGALRNIGPKSAAWLQEVGIHSRADLESQGSVRAFLAVREAGLNSSLNLLYALEAALLDVDWRELPAPLKERLRSAVGKGA